MYLIINKCLKEEEINQTIILEVVKIKISPIWLNMPKESYDLLYNICALNNRQLNGVVLASKIANTTYTKISSQ